MEPTKISDFVRESYVVVDVENKDNLQLLKQQVCSIIAERFPEFKEGALSELHNFVPVEDINELRLEIFQTLNDSSGFLEQYFSLAESALEALCGSELACNAKVNFSIQMPQDNTSILPSHADTFSGESSYQINLWVPLTDCFERNSMHIFTPEATKRFVKNISVYEKQGLANLFEDFEEGVEFKELAVNYGQAIIFSPTTLHGNRLNTTTSTRISLNCRYKNLHSPYNAPEGSSKVLGQFYVPLRTKAATIIGRERSLERLSS